MVPLRADHRHQKRQRLEDRVQLAGRALHFRQQPLALGVCQDARGDVLHDGRRLHGAAVLPEERRAGDLHPDGRPVLASIALHAGPARRLAAQCLFDQDAVRLAVFGDGDLGPGQLQQFLAGVAGDGAELVVDAQQPRGGRVAVDHADRQEVEERAQLLLAPSEGLLQREPPAPGFPPDAQHREQQVQAPQVLAATADPAERRSRGAGRDDRSQAEPDERQTQRVPEEEGRRRPALEDAEPEGGEEKLGDRRRQDGTAQRRYPPPLDEEVGDGVGHGAPEHRAHEGHRHGHGDRQVERRRRDATIFRDFAHRPPRAQQEARAGQQHPEVVHGHGVSRGNGHQRPGQQVGDREGQGRGAQVEVREGPGPEVALPGQVGDQQGDRGAEESVQDGQEQQGLVRESPPAHGERQGERDEQRQGKPRHAQRPGRPGRTRLRRLREVLVLRPWHPCSRTLVGKLGGL